MQTFDSLQKTGSENQLSSITTSGVRGFPVNSTVAIDNVTTTLLTDGNFEHDLRPFIVPFRINQFSLNTQQKRKEKKRN